MIIPIVIDKAEQRPWSFPAEYASVERLHLKTGDYALKNDHGFAIERKSIDDLVGTLSSGAERFDRELTRMLTFPERIIIVEGSWSNILGFEYEHPRVEPQYIRSELCRLTMQGVHIMFADNPHYAAYLAWGIINARWDMIEHGLFKKEDSDAKVDG